MVKFYTVALLLLLGTQSVFTQTIKGKISNVLDGKLLITYSYDYLYKQTDTVELKPDGSFEKKFGFKEMGTVHLNTSDVYTSVPVFPESDLRITADGETRKKFEETLSITGKGSEICVESLTYKDDKLKNINWDYNLPADSFVMRLVDWRNVKNQITRKLVKKTTTSSLPPAHIRYFLTVDSLNNLYWTIGAFRDYHNNRLGKTSEEDSFFQQYIAPHLLQTEQKEFMAAGQYRYFWDRYSIYHFDWRKKGKDSTLLKDKPWMAGRLEETVTKTTGKIRQVVLADIFLSEYKFCYEYYPEKDFPIYDSLLLVYGKKIDNPAVLQKAIALCDLQKQRRTLTAKGKNAPDFLLTDSSGKQYTLKDFNGKIIYLDVWASWCGPCIKELPDYKKLAEKLKDRDDLVFLSASIDNTKEDWVEKGLRKHDPPGLQLWAGKGGWNSIFAKDYFLSGVPKYVLIDRHGKIINFEAPRPSSGEEIETALSDALKN